MKSKAMLAALTACLALALPLSSPAAQYDEALAAENAQSSKVLEVGQWADDSYGRRYVYADGSFARDQWKGIGGYVYHFDANGYMEASRPVETSVIGDSYNLNDQGQLYVIQAYNSTPKLVTYRYDAPVDTYDPLYPLKGMLNQYGLEEVPLIDMPGESSFFAIGDASDVNAKYRLSNSNIIREYAYALSGNIADIESIQRKIETGSEGFVYADTMEDESAYPLAQQVLNEIRAFLNSFDFKNATEMEKAQKVAEYVSRASYDYATYNEWLQRGGQAYYKDHWQSASIYGCLVGKNCVCQGYSDAYRILARMVGLLCTTAERTDHSWNYVRIDGEWWTVSNGELFAPGTRVSGFSPAIPTFEEYYSSYQGTNPYNVANWAYLP